MNTCHIFETKYCQLSAVFVQVCLSRVGWVLCGFASHSPPMFCCYPPFIALHCSCRHTFIYKSEHTADFGKTQDAECVFCYEEYVACETNSISACLKCVVPTVQTTGPRKITRYNTCCLLAPLPLNQVIGMI